MPIVVPLIGEVNQPPINRYLGKLCLLEEQCQYILTPESETEFIVAVKNVMQNPGPHRVPIDIAQRWVNNWIAPIDGSSADVKVVDLLKKTLL